jgi:hypothetical protein
MQFVEELIDHWYRKFVLGSLCVERVVVDAEPLRLVCLAHQENRHRKWRRARADNPLRQHLHTLSFQLILLQLRVVIGAYGDRRSTPGVD